MSQAKTFQSTRFGAIEYTTEDVVTFSDGLLGFPQYQEYLILQHKEGSPFRWLQSLEWQDLAFLVVDPAHFLEGYNPPMPPQEALALGMTAETVTLVYVVVTIPPGQPDLMSINLAGPIVINAETRQARQVVVEDDSYPIKFFVVQPKPAEEPAAA